MTQHKHVTSTNLNPKNWEWKNEKLFPGEIFVLRQSLSKNKNTEIVKIIEITEIIFRPVCCSSQGIFQWCIDSNSGEKIDYL